MCLFVHGFIEVISVYCFKSFILKYKKRKPIPHLPQSSEVTAANAVVSILSNLYPQMYRHINTYMCSIYFFSPKIKQCWDFSSGLVVKILPCEAGDTDLIPG